MPTPAKLLDYLGQQCLFKTLEFFGPNVVSPSLCSDAQRAQTLFNTAFSRVSPRKRMYSAVRFAGAMLNSILIGLRCLL